MPYARLDDGFHAHPKVVETSLAALGLFAKSLSYAACFLTDGALRRPFVEHHVRGRLARQAARELVERGFWREADEGYAIIGYLDYNRSREQVEADRRAARKKRARQRAQGRLDL